MIKPRRIIFYLLDGVSAIKVRSFNSDKVNDHYNKKFGDTYLDELYKESYVKKYCYGFDDTNQAMYLINSGQSHIESPISLSNDPKNLRMNKWMVDMLKEKGYIKRAHCFANFYRGLDDVPWKFDKLVHMKRTYFLEDANLPDSFWFKDKTFLFILDCFTHDRGSKEYNHHITTEEYEKFILESNNIIKKNLKFLKFDPDLDLLVMFSDHGLTLDQIFAPEGNLLIDNIKMAFNKERLGRWLVPGQEIKSRIIFMMRNNNIKHQVDEGVCTLQDAFAVFMKHLGFNNYLTDKAKEYLSENQAIIQAPGIYPPNIFGIFRKILLNDRFYQFIHVTGKGLKRKKWIYQIDTHKGVYYDLEKDPFEQNPVYIKYKQLPQIMRQYIEEYKKTRINAFKWILLRIKNRDFPRLFH